MSSSTPPKPKTPSISSTEADEEKKAIQAVEAIFERYNLIASSSAKPSNHLPAFDAHVMTPGPGSLKILTASPQGSVSFSLLIDERYANLNGVMHGGAAGVIFDMATTTALGPLARPGFWDFMGGVTRSLNISYLRAIPIGTTIHLHSQVIQAGKTMAMIRGQMTNPEKTITYATCEHHKVNVPTLPAHLLHKIPWDELWDDLKGGGKIDGKVDGGKNGEAKL